MSIQKPRAAIVTRHDVPNYGSFLQALATQRLFEELSYDATIIDYKREDDSTTALIKQYSEEHNNFLYKIYYQTFWRYSHSHIERVLGEERKKYFHCSDPVDKDTIKNALEGYDLYVTGSDQVWNAVGSGKTKGIDGVYFWNSLPMGSNIISYAPSFGDSRLSDSDFEKCRDWLKKYRYLSVREDSGVELLKSMGYDAAQVIDPTMLVEGEFWDNIVATASLRPERKYALLYNLHSNSDMRESIKKELSDSGLDIYSITTTFRRGLGKTVFCPSIQDFLYLFKNASCVYADSFHAIAFSIVFNTPIVVTLPKQYSTRLTSILRLFEMEECLSDKSVKKGWDADRINWAFINSKLEEERKKSWEWLKTVTGALNSNREGSA